MIMVQPGEAEGGKEISEEAAVLTQVRDDGGLDQQEEKQRIKDDC